MGKKPKQAISAVRAANNAAIRAAQVTGKGSAFRLSEAKLKRQAVSMHEDFQVEHTPFLAPVQRMREQGEAGFVRGVGFKMEKAYEQALMNRRVPMQGVTNDTGEWTKGSDGKWVRVEDLTRQMRRLSMAADTPEAPPEVVPPRPPNNLPLRATPTRERVSPAYSPYSPAIIRSPAFDPMDIAFTPASPTPSNWSVQSLDTMMRQARRDVVMRDVPQAQPMSEPAPKRPADRPLADATLVDSIPPEELLGMRVLRRGKKSVLDMLGGRY